MTKQTLIASKALSQKISLSPTTIWRLEKAGKFPKRRKISANRVAWVLSEVEDWISEITNNGEGSNAD